MPVVARYGVLGIKTRLIEVIEILCTGDGVNGYGEAKMCFDASGGARRLGNLFVVFQGGREESGARFVVDGVFGGLMGGLDIL